MRKFLSIIIPHYKESEKDVFPLLSSISIQAGIDLSDIEIIIANDGGAAKLDKDFLGLFGMDIRQLSLTENKGPGVARQAGLDTAQGQYAMFCDADDVLHNVGVLGALMQEAEKTAADILSSSWLEENIDNNGDNFYITHEIENTWMFGKLIRREFLKQNNIRFHDDLRVHEDSYFLSIASDLAQRRNHLPVTTYVWKCRLDSITRRNNASYAYDSIPEFIRACAMADVEVEKRAPEKMEYKIVQFTLYNYFCFHQPGWQDPKHKKYLDAAENAFVKYMSPMWHYWKDAPKETVAKIYNEERMKNFSNCMEAESVWNWIARIGIEKNV